MIDVSLTGLQTMYENPPQQIILLIFKWQTFQCGRKCLIEKHEYRRKIEAPQGASLRLSHLRQGGKKQWQTGETGGKKD